MLPYRRLFRPGPSFLVSNRNGITVQRCCKGGCVCSYVGRVVRSVEATCQLAQAAHSPAAKTGRNRTLPLWDGLATACNRHRKVHSHLVFPPYRGEITLLWRRFHATVKRITLLPSLVEVFPYFPIWGGAALTEDSGTTKKTYVNGTLASERKLRELSSTFTPVRRMPVCRRDIWIPTNR